MRLLRFLVPSLLAVASTSAMAQRQGGGPPQGGRPRQQLEADVRRQFARVVRARVGLSEEQMQKLGPMSERHAVARRRLQMDERATRLELQLALTSPAPADSTVERLLARFNDIQKQRAQLIEAEQRDLATIMSPVQRARFNAIHEQLRRQIDQRRGQAMPPRRGGGRPPV